MGNPEGDITLKRDIYWKILRGQVQIIGTWNSKYDESNTSDWKEACKFISEGKLQLMPLITHIYPQEKLNEALELMKKHEEPYCKVMINWNKEE